MATGVQISVPMYQMWQATSYAHLYPSSEQMERRMLGLAGFQPTENHKPQVQVESLPGSNRQKVIEKSICHPLASAQIYSITAHIDRQTDTFNKC